MVSISGIEFSLFIILVAIILFQVPMNLFMMYMVGSSISIFPIMMVGMMFVRPIRALLSMNTSTYLVIKIFLKQIINILLFFKLLKCWREHMLLAKFQFTFWVKLLLLDLLFTSVNPWDFYPHIPQIGWHLSSHSKEQSIQLEE